MEITPGKKKKGPHKASYITSCYTATNEGKTVHTLITEETHI